MFCCTTIFIFSNQKSSVSTNTSNGFIYRTVNVFEKISGIEISEIEEKNIINNK